VIELLLPWLWLDATDDIRIEDEMSYIEPCLEPPTYIVRWLFDVEDEEGSWRDS